MYRTHRTAAVRVAAVLAATGLVAGTAGCASSSDDDVAADGTVTLSYFSWLPSPDQWEPIIAQFEEENPTIKIDFKGANDSGQYLGELDNLILADDTPDVYGIQATSAFDDYADYALDTEEYASDWIGGVKSELLDETTTSDGVVAAVPILTAGSEFYLYNKTLFDELGLSLPTDYDELLAVSEAAKAAGYTGFAMGAADGWHDDDFFIWLANQYGDGGEIYEAGAGEIPWDSDALVEAATKWQELFSDGAFQEAATSTTLYPQARDDYLLARKALAMPTGSWHVSATLSTNGETPGSAVENDELGMAPMPTLGDNEAKATTGVDYALMLSADLSGAKLDAAAKFAEFMAVGAGQQIWVNTMQGFPAATGVDIQLPDGESEIALASVKLVTDTIQASENPRKIRDTENDALETDLGVVLQNIANGADPATELATLNQ
jgi:raffinose/stachyose/melibiose transport system substrate-binding protein